MSFAFIVGKDSDDSLTTYVLHVFKLLHMYILIGLGMLLNI